MVPHRKSQHRSTLPTFEDLRSHPSNVVVKTYGRNLRRWCPPILLAINVGTTAAAHTLRGPAAAPRVSLRVYSEAGCPNCQRLVAGDLNRTLSAAGILDILDFDFIAFGNAYYLQEECPGYPNYSRTAGVACYQKKCSVDDAPAACTAGPVVCQHGAAECAANVLQNCVAAVYPDPAVYAPFNYCYEAAYAGGVRAAEACAAHCDAMRWEDVAACLGDADRVDALTAAAARDTVRQLIPGTPTVVLDGVALSDTAALLEQVCGAYSGDAPVGCPAAGSLIETA
mmetsp:Transcript_42406/g.83317  ORF Transcript_42406/g.83317 Transcript_42406/m.83317 type:complete len:283 (+) Transcript_42406:44-892(+)